jgi:hypothetical protein
MNREPGNTVPRHLCLTGALSAPCSRRALAAKLTFLGVSNMLRVNDLGSDSPLFFSLLEHPCTHDLTVIASRVVTLALWFRAQSRCPRTTRRPCASVETRTCTNPSTGCCSAKCSPLASESPRAWIQVRRSVRQFQLHPERQLANRAAHRRAHLRSNPEVDSRELAASLLSHVWLACVVVESPHTVRKECTSDLSLSGVPVRGQRGKSDQRRST